MKGAHYLLLIEGFECRDCDEWLGIFHDDETLRTAYEEAAKQMAGRPDWYSPHYQVAIYEFLPTEGKTQIICDFGLHGQKFGPVRPEELECFKETTYAKRAMRDERSTNDA